MTVFPAQYVIDNNTLGQLSRFQRVSRFFADRVHIPDEVLHEARGLPDIETLRRRAYPTTPAVLAQLARVMATVSPSDTRLVDLYANHGNADPLVVACALDGQDRDGQYLDAPDWIVVSADRAVRVKAEEFGLRAHTNAEFARILDAEERSLMHR